MPEDRAPGRPGKRFFRQAAYRRLSLTSERCGQAGNRWSNYLFFATCWQRSATVLQGWATRQTHRPAINKAPI